MSTQYPVEVNKQSDQPFHPPFDSLYEHISRVENDLVRIAVNGQPQWGTISTLAERMGEYQVPGVSIAVIDAYKTVSD